MRSLLTICLLLTLNFIGYSQEIKSKKDYFSKVVLLKDVNLEKSVERIILEEKNNTENDVSWYIEFMKDDFVMITTNQIKSLINSYGTDKILTTKIGDKIVFIIKNEFANDTFIETVNTLDLSSFVGEMDYSTHDYSFWILLKEKNKKYKVVKEKKYK